MLYILSKLCRPSSVWLPVAIALGVLPGPEKLMAQVCNPGVGANIGVLTPTGATVVHNGTPTLVAHIGDTIMINSLAVFTSAFGSTCGVTNGQGWVVYPNNSSQKAMQNFTLASSAAGGSGHQCPSADAVCMSFTQTYVVNAADMNQPLSFTTNNGTIGNTCQAFAQFNEVQFAFSVIGTPVGSPGGATACPTVPVLVLFPSIQVTKQCVTNCPPNNAAVYGSPIHFQGTVKNTSDTNTVLSHIAISDSPSASITFSTTTALGNPFDPVVGNLNNQLVPGDSVNYTGSYSPAGSGAALCGPFSDTITVTAQDVTSLVISNTASATCSVCTTPCIAVTANCDTVKLGAANTLSGSVSNCGNVTLTNVVVSDTLYGQVATFASLAPGASQSYSKTVTNSSCGSFPSTVNATGASLCGGGQVQASAGATCMVACTPAIKVYKQVVCYAAGGCASFDNNLSNQKTATGVRIDPQNDADCPAFCYRITVTNSGNVTLTSVTVTDANDSDGKVLNLSGCGFPTTLPVGGSASCVVTTNHCVNAINVVTASGLGQDSTGAQVPVVATDTNRVLVLPISVSCSVQVLLTNGTAAPTPPTCLTPGTPYIVRTIIINNGQFDLQNVQVTSTGPDQLCNSPFTIANLAVNARRTNDCPFTCDVQSTHTYSVSVSGVASQTTTNGVVCDHNMFGQQIVASNTTPCSASVCCAGCPQLRVTKGVACVVCTTNANGIVLECASFNGQFNKDAFGIRSDTQEPAFCYEITVSNNGQVPLVNLVVSDNRFGVLTNNVTLGVGGELVFRLTTNWISFAPNDKSLAYAITNTVTASSTSPSYIGCPNVDSGGTISSSDFAIAHVRPLAITCEKLVSVNGGTPTDSFSASGLIATNIVWYAVVHNTGQADAENIVITESNSGNGLPCNVNITIPLLDAGNSTGLIPLCTNGGFSTSACVETNIQNSIQVVAQAAAEGTNCVWDIHGSNITARTTCQATVNLTCPKAGCTPGFWKNCTIHWGPTGYSTSQSVSSVFNLGNCCTSLGGISLLDALSLPGGSGTCGGAQILLHAAVAGLLNASSPELGGLYPLTKEEVLGMVNAALQSCDRDMMTTLGGEIDRDNNSGCNGPNGGLPCHRLDFPRFAPTKVLDPTRTAPTAPTR
jgi:uncharacterized repeat protein (TIGR01451 family)